MRLTPHEAMQLAINEAKKGAGFVTPNPLVGCVILSRDFALLSSGYHQKCGEAHAEVNALALVKDLKQLDGAHVFVTLEPCAHEGRTPSCAKSLSKLPIASVTYGLVDPNPLVSGQGAEILRASGKQVNLFSDLKDELVDLAEVFLINQLKKRPFVSVKVASSLDGRIALSDGSSQWITGDESRQRVQILRGEHDAVLTGSKTILRDDAKLNSRHPPFQKKSQRLVILDPAGELRSTLPSQALFSVRRPEDIFICISQKFTSTGFPEGVKVIELPCRDPYHQEFDLQQLLMTLYEHQIFSVLVEAGAVTVSSFLQAGLVDRLHLFLAPVIMGKGINWTDGVVFPTMDEVLRLTKIRRHRLGPDEWLSARLWTAPANV